MFIRCRGCHGTVWLETERSSQKLVRASCRRCLQQYEVKGVTGRAGRELAAKATEFASERQVDLPGAYSVLLEIMTLETLREVSNSAAHESAPAGTPRQAFDPSFKAAVDAGQISARQALERGSRDSYAASIAKRHKLSMEVAYTIADNKVALLEALRARNAAQETPLRAGTERAPASRLGWVMAALLVIAILVVVHQTRDSGGTGGSMASRRIGDANVRTDARGRVVQVSGPDPRSVLRTFCVAGDRPFHAVGTVPSSRNTRARLGLLKDPSDQNRLLAITIREDPAANGWVAGDGNSPLEADTAPHGILEASKDKPSTAEMAGSPDALPETGKDGH